jgi:hypothetical protein
MPTVGQVLLAHGSNGGDGGTHRGTTAVGAARTRAKPPEQKGAECSQTIDWTLTTWEGAQREQLRRWAALPLERIIVAIEEMGELAERLAPSSSSPDIDGGG